MKKIIPDAAFSQHGAVLGKTGSGKTTAVKAAIVEPLLETGRQVVIVDPTSAWWGLRSSSNGEDPGFPVLVLGGDHGDMPLPPNSGAEVAKLATDQRISLVADTSLMTVADRTRWFIDFATTLYRFIKSPLHLVLDEAHNFAPQGKVPDPLTGKMLHAANNLVSGGRSRGIRCWMITQRPQKLHKDMLTCADTLVALRVLAPQDRTAVEDWIKGCGDTAQGREVLNSLAGLQRGEGWVWYPEGNHLERTKFPRIRTFDSSATPVDGEILAAPKTIAQIDLVKIRAALEQSIEEAADNDVEALRAEIKRLKAQVSNAKPDPEALEQARENGYIRGRDDAIESMRMHLDTLSSRGTWRSGARPVEEPESAPAPAAPARPAASKKPAPNASSDVGTGGQRRILIALAQRPQGLNAQQIAIRAGLSSKSGTYSNYLSKARVNGWIEGDRGSMVITAAGKKALGHFEPLPTGKRLLDYWLNDFGKSGEARILSALADVYPKILTKEHLGQRAGLSVTSGTFSNYVSRLRTLELIDGNAANGYRATKEFFE